MVDYCELAGSVDGKAVDVLGRMLWQSRWLSSVRVEWRGDGYGRWVASEVPAS
jgi:hypothetical protein